MRDRGAAIRASAWRTARTNRRRAAAGVGWRHDCPQHQGRCGSNDGGNRGVDEAHRVVSHVVLEQAGRSKQQCRKKADQHGLLVRHQKRAEEQHRRDHEGEHGEALRKRQQYLDYNEGRNGREAEDQSTGNGNRHRGSHGGEPRRRHGAEDRRGRAVRPISENPEPAEEQDCKCGAHTRPQRTHRVVGTVEADRALTPFSGPK